MNTIFKVTLSVISISSNKINLFTLLITLLISLQYHLQAQTYYNSNLGSGVGLQFTITNPQTTPSLSFDEATISNVALAGITTSQNYTLGLTTIEPITQTATFNPISFDINWIAGTSFTAASGYADPTYNVSGAFPYVSADQNNGFAYTVDLTGTYTISDPNHSVTSTFSVPLKFALSINGTLDTLNYPSELTLNSSDSLRLGSGPLYTTTFDGISFSQTEDSTMNFGGTSIITQGYYNTAPEPSSLEFLGIGFMAVWGFFYRSNRNLLPKTGRGVAARV